MSETERGYFLSGKGGTAVLVTGGVDYSNRQAIEERLGHYPPGTLVIHGAARGADQMAGEVARATSKPVVVVPYFGHLGRAGGPVRNKKMLTILLGLEAMGYSISVEAFHPDLKQSKGTKDMVRIAKRANIKVTVTP